MSYLSTVPGLNLDMCINSARIKTHLTFRNYSTSGEVPQNHIYLPSTHSQALTTFNTHMITPAPSGLGIAPASHRRRFNSCRRTYS